MRIRPAVVATALGAAALTPIAHATPPGRVVHVHGTVHGVEDLSPNAALCTKGGGQYDPQGFPTVYSGTLTFRGTVHGNGAFCGWIPPTVNANGTLNYYETNELDRATIDGCGTGTLIYHVQGVIKQGYDAARNAIPAIEDWSVVPGSGTGDLADVTSGGGRGQNGWVNLTPSISPPAQTVDGELRGVVRCHG